MKARHFFIASLGLNLALAATLLVLRREPPAIPTVVRSPSAITPANPEVSTKAIAIAADASAATNASFHWRLIESPDYRQYIANLRAISCPDRTIRDIIVADIDQLYAAKNKSAPAVPPPWQNADHRRAAERERSAKSSALKAEKRALVKELIGYEWDNHVNEQWHEDSITALLLGFLPGDKAPQLLAVAEKYGDLAEDVKEQANGVVIDEDRARLRQLYDGLIAEASQLLTPTERDELELRVQAAMFLPASGDVHWDGVAITGPMLREFVRLSKSYQDEFRNGFLEARPLTEQQKAVRRAAFEKQVEQLFGPARYAEYRRAQDTNFRDLLDFTQEHKLPQAAAIRIYDTRRAAETQAGQVQADQTLSPEEQSAALAVLKAATARTVSSALGKNYSEYLEGPGQWLAGLAVPSPSAPGKQP